MGVFQKLLRCFWLSAGVEKPGSEPPENLICVAVLPYLGVFWDTLDCIPSSTAKCPGPCYMLCHLSCLPSLVSTPAVCFSFNLLNCQHIILESKSKRYCTAQKTCLTLWPVRWSSDFSVAIGSLDLTHLRMQGKLHWNLSSLIQLSSVTQSTVWSFVIRWTAAPQASLSITNSQSLLKLMSIESVMPSNHLILCRPLLPPSIFPSIRLFSIESVLHIILVAKALELPLQHQSFQWIFGTDFLRIDCLTSLLSKGLSRVFSNTTVHRHQFFGT